MNDFYPQLIQVWNFLNSCLIYLCFVRIKSALEVFEVIILKPPAVTPQDTLVSGRDAGTLSSWGNFVGECWESSDPDSVLHSYISRQGKNGVTKRTAGWGWGLAYTYTTSQCWPNGTVMVTLPLGQVLFYRHPNDPKCTFQSGTTLCCLKVPVTLQHHPKKSSTGRHFKWVMRLNVTLLSASSVCCVCDCQLWYHHRYF